MHTKFYFENLKGRDYFRDLGVAERTTLKWILEIEFQDVN
jgi:hypothetical protein